MKKALGGFSGARLRWARNEVRSYEAIRALCQPDSPRADFLYERYKRAKGILLAHALTKDD